MIQKVFNWLIQPLGRVALLIAALGGSQPGGLGSEPDPDDARATDRIPAYQTFGDGHSVFVLPSRRDAWTFGWSANSLEVLGLSSANCQDQRP